MSLRKYTLVDLSSYQGHVDGRRLALAGVAGGWVKASQGTHYHNPAMLHQYTELSRNGMRAGFYHFADVLASSAEQEARYFASVTGHIAPRDLRPVLDLETNAHHLSPSALEHWARTWIQTTKRLLGVGALLYSYSSFLESQRWARPVGYGLWLAAYSSNDGAEHPYAVPRPWKRAVAHQFTSNGKLPGVNGRVDLSHADRMRPLLAHPVAGLL